MREQLIQWNFEKPTNRKGEKGGIQAKSSDNGASIKPHPKYSQRTFHNNRHL
uniref:Uncharacterized protein n=1 Tax=Rhizophora mucronata TaxID=61149 RepID=A0A2P2Q906_RHIMU